MEKVAEGYGLLEGARWYPDWGLLFSDMTNGGVYRQATSSNQPEVLIPHRKGIGGLVRHADGGLIVTGRNVAHKSPDGTTTVLLGTMDDEVFFNDLGVDASGRLLVGSVATDPLAHGDGTAEGRLGRLYLLELDGAATVLYDDVVVSNGIGSAANSDRVYHVDTGRNMVWVLRPSDGWREPFATTSGHPGEPDGLAVAADGSVWVAMAGGGLVVGWDPSGTVRGVVEVPQPLVTSVCFGGPELETLFVLTGPDSGTGGAVYETAAPAPGRPAPLARVRVAPPAA